MVANERVKGGGGKRRWFIMRPPPPISPMGEYERRERCAMTNVFCLSERREMLFIDDVESLTGRVRAFFSDRRNLQRVRARPDAPLRLCIFVCTQRFRCGPVVAKIEGGGYHRKSQPTAPPSRAGDEGEDDVAGHATYPPHHHAALYVVVKMRRERAKENGLILASGSGRE